MIRSPFRAAAAIAFVALVAWTLQTWLHAGYFTVIAVLLVWGQVASFFLPTYYTLTEDSIAVRGALGRREKAWSDFRSYLIDREGVLLSPFEERSRLERFRGLSLQFHGNRDDVVAFVDRAMARHQEGAPANETAGSDNGADAAPRREERFRVGDEGQTAHEGDRGRES
jgi:hypothetical protein